MISDEGTIRQAASLLSDFLKSQRWFRAKAKTIQGVEIQDVLPIAGTRFYILVVRVDYTEGDHDSYVLTTRGDGAEDQIQEALWDQEFRDSLIVAIACDTRIPGRVGDLIASHTNALRQECVEPRLKLESVVSGAEQSNTSIIYGDQFILKLFRRIEPGVNPDLEIGAFLTEHGFEHTPAVLGKLEYQSRNSQDVYAVGILQEFVRNQGDAWKYTLESLDGFFDRALAQRTGAPALKTYHPLELIDDDMPADARELLRSYIDSARLLGTRTAQMHAALAGSADPGFAPERFTHEDGQKLYRDAWASRR